MGSFATKVAPPPPPPAPTLEFYELSLVATAFCAAVPLVPKLGPLYAARAPVGLVAALVVLFALDAEAYEMYVWPPSTSSAPALCSIVVVFFVLTANTFSITTRSEDQERVREIKKKLKLAQLTQAIRWDKEDPKEEPAAETVDSNGAPAPAPASGAAAPAPAAPAEESDQKKEEDKEKKDEKEEKEKKKPPEVPELFGMLFDDVEERHVTEYGIAADDEAYAGCLKLFRERVPIELAEAARCTRIARAGLSGVAASAEDLSNEDDIKRVALFKDGTKLKGLVDLYNKKISKHFGKGLVGKSVLSDAKETLKELELEQRKGSMEVIISLVRPSVPLYVAAIILMTFDSAVGAATMHGSARLLDKVDKDEISVDELRGEYWVVFFKMVLCVFSHLTARTFSSKCKGRFGNAVRTAVLRGVMRQDTVFFDVYPSGVIQQRINHDAGMLAGKLFDMPLSLLHCCLHVVTNSIAIYTIQPRLFYILVAPMPVISFVQRAFIRFMSRMHERTRKVSEHVAASTNEMVMQLRTVRSFAMEEEEAEMYGVNSQYKTEIEEYASIVHHVAFIAPLIMMFIGLEQFAGYMGGTYVAQKLVTVGMAVQMQNCAGHLQHSTRAIMDMIPELLQVTAPIGRVCEMINSKPTIEPYPGQSPKLTIPIVGRIDFKDVNFTFPTELQKQILHSLTFSALPGKKVAFCGPTGCGKSTAIQLIQRFYAPSSGEIFLDHKPLESFDVHYLRRKISVVAQDNVLFSTTIRENITYGLPKAVRDKLTTEEVEAACKRANALDFIRAFPRVLETYCGEKGVKLSGGQKQRLAIARAIIRTPKVILLDEATSALDSKSEAVVQKALDAMVDTNTSGCTIVIAHRLSTIKNCDEILCMQKGHVLERGTHDQLLKIAIKKTKDEKEMVSGLYNDLWTTQMGDGKDQEKKGPSGEKPSETIRRLMEENSLLKKKLAIAQHHSMSEEEHAKARVKWRKAGFSIVALSRMSSGLKPDGREMMDGDDDGIPADAPLPMRSKTLPTYLSEDHA